MAKEGHHSPPFAEGVGDAELKKQKRQPLGDLKGDHRKLAIRAITRVLSTDIAEITYAQVVDGLPLADVSRETDSPYLQYRDPLYRHPVYNHTQLCRGVIEKTRAFRDSFHPGTLEISTSLFLAYEGAGVGSRVFKTRLIEIVAVCVHEIAVRLFQLDISLHKDDGVVDWTPPKPEPGEDWRSTPSLWWTSTRNGHFQTLFFHKWYTDHDRYANGAADIVGYWAESRILGGMVQFDRRASGDIEAVYFHSDRRGSVHPAKSVTYRIYELLPEQRQLLYSFLASDEDPSENPLPIFGGDLNTHRFDPEESSATNGIYRDIWERLELLPDESDNRLRDI